MSSEKVTLWKRITDFWSIYRRSKMGLVGLAILASFVFMAIFAPFLTPYDPITDRELADWLAYPDWIGLIDPGKSNLPQNVEVPIVKQVLQGKGEATASNSSLIQTTPGSDSLVIEVLDPVGASFHSENLTIKGYFNYQFDPPDTLMISIWGKLTGDTDNFYLKASFDVTKPNGEKVKVWESMFTEGFLTSINMGEKFKVRSSSPVLLMRLGLPPTKEALAHKVFTEKGTFQLQAIFEFITLGAGRPGRLKLELRDLRFIVLGLRFGVMGTDDMARDIFSQIVYGSRVSLMVGFATAFTSVMLGVLVGMVAGYVGGRVDEALMRFADLIMVLPGLPLIIVVAMMIKGSLTEIVLLLSLLGWGGGARTMRAFVLSIKNKVFVEASKARGAGTWRIIFRHILPAVMPLAYAGMALAAPIAITTEAELSFLGVGGSPFIISWGKILQFAQTRGAFQYKAWWWIIPPGLCIALISLGFIMIGHSLDEILNPRLRRR